MIHFLVLGEQEIDADRANRVLKILLCGQKIGSFIEKEYLRIHILPSAGVNLGGLDGTRYISTPPTGWIHTHLTRKT